MTEPLSNSPRPPFIRHQKFLETPLEPVFNHFFGRHGRNAVGMSSQPSQAPVKQKDVNCSFYQLTPL